MKVATAQTERRPRQGGAPRLRADRIEAVRTSIDAGLLDTPQRECAALSRHLGCETWLKDETANRLGCFKGRGADAFVAELPQGTSVAVRERKVLVCASAGNFGLALADAGRRNGMRVEVFVSSSANAYKVQRIAACGGVVKVDGSDFDEAKAAAREYARSNGHLWVEDGAERAIAEGAGTIAIELARAGRFDAVVIPVGNGALLAGMGAWLRERVPETRIIAVCSTGAPVMRACWQHGLSAAAATVYRGTIADGIAVRVPVPEAVADLDGVVDDFLEVDDDDILAAMRVLYEVEGQAVEPAAAVGIAALVRHPDLFAGKRVATVLTGGNLTAEQRHAWFSQQEPIKE